MDQKRELNLFMRDRGIGSARTDQYVKTLPENMTRAIIEERPTRFAEIDVFSRLIMDRIIFLGLPVDDVLSNVVVAQLLFLSQSDSEKDITMYVNSPGGSVTAGLAMYDTMQFVDPDIQTYCTGIAASMGAVLFGAGAKGKRGVLPHARVMLHQPSGGMQGQASDMKISLELIMSMQEDLYKILAHHTGKDYDTIHADCDRDYWLKAQEAVDYGIADEIVTPG